MRPSVRAPNLSSEHTSFIGREIELRDLEKAARGGGQLVTLLGPAGTGKTRLARRYGAERLAEYASEGGVWFCDLTEAHSASDAIACLCATLGVRPAAGDTTMGAAAQLGHALAARGRVLVVLDNFEQVVQHAAATVEVWLDLAPRALFVVTSREPLRLEREVCLAVRGLALGEAVALLADRARRAGTGSPIEPDDATAVEALCDRLDRNPLAIELAAARLKVLSPQKLLERLGDRLDLLRSTAHDRAARHATLRAALDWSWELLAPWERDALAQCSVFHGGFTLEAAEAVLAPAHLPSGTTVIDCLEALIDKSLLRRDDVHVRRGEVRFSLYETIRVYAYDALGASGGEPAAVARHSAHYVGAAPPHDEIDGAPPTPASLEIDNVLAVLRRSVPRDPDLAARAALALHPVLAAHRPSDAHVEVLDASLGAPPAAPALRARLHLARGRVQLLRGRLEEARVDLERALEDARPHVAPCYMHGARDEAAAGAVELVPRILCALSELHVDAGRLAAARAAVDEAITLAAATQDARTGGLGLYGLGRMHMRAGELDLAARRAEESLEIAVRLGLRPLECRCQNLLGGVRMWQGRHADAQRHFTAALSIARELGEPYIESTALANLVALSTDLGKHDESATLCEEALLLARRMGYRLAEGIALGLLGALEHDRGRFAVAAPLFEQAIRIHRDAGSLRAVAIHLQFSAMVDLEEGRLDEAGEKLDRALAMARELGLDVVEAYGALRLGALEAVRGRPAEARAALARARAGEPAGGAQLRVAREVLEILVEPDARAAERLAASAEMASRSAVVRTARRIVERALSRSPRAPAVAPARSAPDLVLGAEARWFSVGAGARVDLSRRGGVRRMLAALGRRRLDAPGRALSVDELFEAGWPGERVGRDAAVRRVYTSIGVLRDLGLRDVLLLRDDGYLLDPAVALRDSSETS